MFFHSFIPTKPVSYKHIITRRKVIETLYSSTSRIDRSIGTDLGINCDIYVLRGWSEPTSNFQYTCKSPWTTNKDLRSCLRPLQIFPFYKILLAWLVCRYLGVHTTESLNVIFIVYQKSKKSHSPYNYTITKDIEKYNTLNFTKE